MIKVENVRLQEVGTQDQVAEDPSILQRRDTERDLQRLGRRHPMRDRADAADARRDAWQFLHGPALGELFKTPQLWDHQVGVGDISLVVEKDIDPAVKVLLSSGYSIDGQASKILSRGCDGFIQKPFDIKSLSFEIRKILDNKSKNSSQFLN